MGPMAALIQMMLNDATQDDFYALDALVSRSMMEAGGPPAGLMSHMAYPSGDGVKIADVWSTEAQGTAYVEEVLRPLIDEAGLTVGATETAPVWSFARP